MQAEVHDDHIDRDVLEVALTGHMLLENPLLNKGSGFPEDERRGAGGIALVGRFPTGQVRVQADEAHRQRLCAWHQVRKIPQGLSKVLPGGFFIVLSPAPLNFEKQYCLSFVLYFPILRERKLPHSSCEE